MRTVRQHLKDMNRSVLYPVLERLSQAYRFSSCRWFEDKPLPKWKAVVVLLAWWNYLTVHHLYPKQVQVMSKCAWEKVRTRLKDYSSYWKDFARCWGSGCSWKPHVGVCWLPRQKQNLSSWSWAAKYSGFAIGGCSCPLWNINVGSGLPANLWKGSIPDKF